MPMVSYIMSGFDVICSAYGVIYIEPVMTYIHFFSKNWYIVSNVKNTLSVMSGIVAGKAQDRKSTRLNSSHR